MFPVAPSSCHTTHSRSDFCAVHKITTYICRTSRYEALWESTRRRFWCGHTFENYPTKCHTRTTQFDTSHLRYLDHCVANKTVPFSFGDSKNVHNQTPTATSNAGKWSGAALHHHSLTNEKFRSFAALRLRQEMNLTLDCNHLQLRIRSLLPSCRATAHAHL